MNEKFIEWFIKEIPVLTEKGIITAQTAHSLNEYYINKLEELRRPVEEKPQAAVTTTKPTAPVKAPSKKVSKISVSVILTIIASVLISFGIISLIAYNWAAIPRMAKAITAILLLTGTQAAGAILILKGKSKITKIRESYSLFWALLFGAMVAFVSQIFKFPGDSATFMLVWTVSSIIITLLFSAHTTFYLSLLFTLIFAITGWEKTSALLLYPICAALYFPARKSKAKVIPLLILSYLLFIFRIDELPINVNAKALIFVFSLASIGLIFLGKHDKSFTFFGIIITALASMISIFASRYYSSDTIEMNATNCAELILICIITTGLYAEAAVIPFVKRIRNKEKLSFENLLYMLPSILGLNALFPAQNEILLNASLSQWYKIFLAPFTLIILYTMAMFIISSLKNNKLSWGFFAFLLIETLKINEVSVSLFYTFIALTLFIPLVILWKNKFAVTDESSVTIITTRVISAILFFIPAFMSLFIDETFYSTSKLPGIGFLCFIPAAVCGITLSVQYARKDLKEFLKNLDIIINLIFAIISMAAASKSNKTAIDLMIKIFVALNFMYYSIVAIKKEKYIFLLNTALSLAYFLMSLLAPEYGTTIMYLFCAIMIFAAGSFLWKNNFTSTAEIKNCFLIVRIAAVLILFITILLARKAESVLYTNKGIDLFILCSFTPVAFFGLFMCGIFAKKNFKEFMLNIDIFINILVSAIILSVSYLCDEKVILLILEIIIGINLISSCIYIIRSGRYEYAFYALFAIIYFVISFMSTEFSTTILYLVSTIILFTSGVFLWRENFTLNETSKQTLFITRAVSAAILLGTTLLARYPDSILYDNNGIEKYILICFTPAALFGLTLYFVLAKKNIMLFLENIDIVINLFFSSLIFAIAYLCKAKPTQLISEFIMILNLLAACIYILKDKKYDFLFYPAFSLIYFFVAFASTDKSNIAAGIFFIIAIIAAVIHFFAQTKNISGAKVVCTITTGIVLFYETSIRHLTESDHNHLACNFYIIACMIIMGAVAVYYLLQLIKNKIFFNPAVFLTPVLVIVLTFVDDKFSVLLTFPVILVFCIYYFYLAYKNDSLKTANLSTIYFGLMLMIRFFSSGYGLSVQGITLISMGAILLIMNILMTKRREKNA